jgi:hypothetical protein
LSCANEKYLNLRNLNTAKNDVQNDTCGELRLADASKKVTLAGWVQRVRRLGGNFVVVVAEYQVGEMPTNPLRARPAYTRRGACAPAGWLCYHFCS